MAREVQDILVYDVDGTGPSMTSWLIVLLFQAHEAKQKMEIVLPDWVKDGDRSYLSRYLPSVETADDLQLETCV